MAIKLSKKAKWIIAAAVVVLVAIVGVRWWQISQTKLPKGIVSGNGRIEARLVDVSPKENLRVKEIRVNEGDVVKPGQVVVTMDTTTLESSLAEARASQAAAEQRLATADANIVKQKSEIDLAAVERNRTSRLLKDGASSRRDLDVRNTKLQTTKATLAEAESMLKTAKEQVEVARLNAQTIQTRIDDATLRSPVVGRVLYRLADPGEVLAAGGKALTIVNLEDVYMEIYLPSDEAAATKIGSEGRITVDYDPDRAAAGYVSFVSPEAQFTPKEVETKSEREKLMFRIKIQIPRELAAHYVERLKTGVRGMGYVKIDPSATWPSWLQNLITVPPSGSPSGTNN
jgi:HlyD family secretion protein